MAITLAKRAAFLKASDIREILKLARRPDVISFAGGLPAPELFPAKALAELAREVLEQEAPRALQYSATEGDALLRELLAARLNRVWGCHASASDILVTTGSQQGLDFVGRLLLDEGDVVLTESPTYVGAISAWRLYQPTWVEVPTDDQGMDIGALKDRLEHHPNAKLIYIVSNFQNPTGLTWSLERRKALVEVAAKWGVPVVEDNPYGELRFEGTSLPLVQAFDPGGLVIGLGTFSKVCCPGLRIGWISAKPPLYEKFVTLKQGADLHSSALDQVLVARYLERYDLDQDIARYVPVYRERRDAMVAALEEHLPAGVRFTRPAGGLFIWLELPQGFNARTLLTACIERGVVFIPGGAFFPNGGREDTLRLSYSNMPVERIREGIKRLGGAMRDFL
ncbi:MAG: PLP-dependent aminotransferase family protein [Holophaga sp.]|jgi:DNA-binding transcriptional MocR family regulator